MNPNILVRDDTFLSPGEIDVYQKLLPGRWTMGPSVTDIKYFSKDLYRHYNWDGDWAAARWLDSSEPDWEILYAKIAKLLPNHYVHWIDLKITPPLCTGTPKHRDKDPGSPGGDHNKFSRAISILCNLNHTWDPCWGGDFMLYSSDNTVYTKIPIVPGQLLIMENCTHSISPITQPDQCRISFILHVLEYK